MRFGIIGTLAYGLRDYANTPNMTPVIGASLGAYFMADVSERLGGKAIEQPAKSRIQMVTAGIQGLLSAVTLGEALMSGENSKYYADSMLLLYTGLTAYAHFVYKDKTVSENRELAAIRELQSNIAVLLNTNAAGIEGRLNALLAENSELRVERDRLSTTNADLATRHTTLKTGLRAEYGVEDGYDSEGLVSEAKRQSEQLEHKQSKIDRLQRQKKEIRKLVTGEPLLTEPEEGIVRDVKDALTSRDQAIVSERQQNTQLRDIVTKARDSERELKNQIQGIEKERDDYQRDNLILSEELVQERAQSAAKDVTIDNQAEQIQSQLSEIEALKLQLRQAQQRSNTRGADRVEEFDNKVAEAAEGLNQTKVEDVQGVSTSNNSKLPTKGGQGYGRGGGND